MILFLSLTISSMIDSIFSFPFHLALTANNAIIFAALPISLNNKKTDELNNLIIKILFSLLGITVVMLNLLIGFRVYKSEVYIKKGLNEVIEKNHIIADDYFKRAVSLNPFNGYALFLYGTNIIMVIKDETKYNKSLSLLEKALKYRDFSSLHFLMAYNYYKLNKIDECKKELIRAEARGYRQNYFRLEK